MDTQLDIFTTDVQSALEYRQSVAANIGVEPEEIQGVRIQLNTLRRQGILVDVAISGVSMFARSVTWTELGMLDDDKRRERFTRGQKYLIPDGQIKRLRSVESLMRRALDEHSYRITGLYPYRWLPFTAYRKFRMRWAELQEQWEDVKADIIAHYDEYVDLLAIDFGEIAVSAWRSIQAAAGGKQPVVFIDGHRFTNQDGFTDHIIAQAVERMPSVAKIKAELKADYTRALVYGEQDFASDELAAAQMKAQADLAREEVRHQVDLNQLVEEERRVQIQAMREAEAEHARERLAEMVSPFEEVFAQMRTRIADDAQTMLDSIQKNGYVRGKIAQQGQGLLDLYDLMAAHSDYELRAKLLNLRAAIGPVGQGRSDAAPERNTDEIAGILQQVVDLSHTAAQDLASGPSRFSMLEI